MYMCFNIVCEFRVYQVDRGEYWKRRDCERIIHKNAFVEFTSRSINKEIVCKYKQSQTR